MKKLLLLILMGSFVVQAGSKPPIYTMDDLPKTMKQMGRYDPFIDSLRAEELVTRRDVIKFLSKEPDFKIVKKTKDGYAKFSHRFFPFTLKLSKHSNRKVDPKERKDLIRYLQCYRDVMRDDILYQNHPHVDTPEKMVSFVNQVIKDKSFMGMLEKRFEKFDDNKR